MKKDIVMYKDGSFVDFQGVERKFIVCALSTSNFNNDEQEVYLTAYDQNGVVQGETMLPRAVFVGVSICSPLDEWNEEKGKMIALSKAKGFKASSPEKSAVLFTTRPGMISELLVQALLTREVEHIQEDPECVIKGYNQMKARYNEKKEMEEYIQAIPENLKELGKTLGALSSDDLVKVITVAAHESE